MAASPVGRNLDIALIPGGAFVVFVGLQPERHFDPARLAIHRVFGRVRPGRVIDPSCPRRAEADVVTESLSGQ